MHEGYSQKQAVAIALQMYKHHQIGPKGGRMRNPNNFKPPQWKSWKTFQTTPEGWAGTMRRKKETLQELSQHFITAMKLTIMMVKEPPTIF